MTVDPRALDPSLFTVPRRELGDTRGTVRFTDVSGGYDVERAEDYYGDPYVGPTYYESQNICGWDRPGRAYLCARWHQIDTDASDKEYLLYPFNVAIYRLPTANFTAASLKKTTQPTGAPSWSALTNIYPGATGTRNGVEWRGSFYVASRENLLRIMSTGEVWSTLAAPGAVGAALAGLVSVGLDDKLVVWWESQGLYTYDGTNWVKIWPSTAAVVPSDAYCDLIFMGPGSLQFLTRNVSGVTTWREYSIEATGTFIASWISEPGMVVWPQGGISFQGQAWVVGRLGSHRNVGILFSKNKLAAPDPVAVLDTNLATDGQQGLDWAWRSIVSVGDVAWMGGSSRQDRNATLYHFEVDQDGEILNPGAVISGKGGPIYSIAQLPYGAAGVSGTERIFISVNGATYYKDADGGATVTDDAAAGMLQFSDIDLGLEDHVRLWADLSNFLTEISANGTVEVQYRVDPSQPDDPWVALGFSSGLDGFTKFAAPDDDAALDLKGTRVRRFQIRLVWTCPTSGSTRDVWDTLSVRFAALFPLGQTDAD